ncbi:hypothetical protein ES692_10435 [Psychroserpens burtonensis]|uniref:Beta-carotene 15,15'-monooxygenase n=1 Tax=Psychroserpens burtonensis TaxID=49278 RepID=A0A5C7B7P5_9FLAO|nr:hypothetical protein [Psychroserpens burtonensis]TXE17069.1 hypothetical protein ES692_10435 [Psychroserpens burtonensis]
MTKTSTFQKNTIAFIIPLALLILLVFLTNTSLFSVHQSFLSPFVTIDFMITIPILYFLLIRKRSISNVTVAPFLILCIVIASYTIPSENQDLLSLSKTWLIPIIELSVLAVIIIKVRKARTLYKTSVNYHQDFYSALVTYCASLFPKNVAKLVANEVALIYYGFFNFKKTILKDNEFSNYKGSGILSTLSALILVVGIEMITVHIISAKWSPTLAWVLTGLSIYSALQLIGIIRSVPKRPITINEHHLQLRFGILSETTIPYDAIDRIEIINSSDFDKEKGTKTLSLLGELEQSNIVIYLKSPQQLDFIYGKPKTFTKLLLFVDDNQNFKSKVEAYFSE